MLTIITILIFIIIFVVAYNFLGMFLRNKEVVSIRLEKVAKESHKTVESELNQPIFIRIIRPLLNDVSKKIIKVTPKEFISNFEKKVMRAGNPYNLGVNDWINIQVAFVVGIPIITAFIGFYKNMDIRYIIFMAFTEIAMGLILPNFILNKRIRARQKEILNSLPNVLDLLTVSVEAGLGFDGALSKVIDKMPGPLADEFEEVLQEMKVGKPKKEALKDMADKLSVQDLSTFIGSVIQADQLGVSIGNVLRIQSEQMRQKRRQRAQEKAMKAPVKMLIPMVLFIFPTIFSVLMGPVALKVMKMFVK